MTPISLMRPFILPQNATVIPGWRLTPPIRKEAVRKIGPSPRSTHLLRRGKNASPPDGPNLLKSEFGIAHPAELDQSFTVRRQEDDGPDA